MSTRPRGNSLESFKKSLSLFSKAQKFKYWGLAAIQFLISLLDFIAVGALGILVIIATASNESTAIDGVVGTVLEIFKDKISNDRHIILFLAVLVATLFVVKSLMALVLARKSLFFLSDCAVKISSDFFEKFFKQDLGVIYARSSHETAASINWGIPAATLGILGSGSLIISELGLFVLLAIGLTIVDPILSIFAISYFFIIFYVLQKTISQSIIESGQRRALGDVKALSVIQRTINSFREIFVSDKIDFVSGEYRDIRKSTTRAIAQSQWIGLIPKYAMEAALVFGIVLLTGIQLVRSDSALAFGTLTIFLGAGSRILPSILRIQGALNLLQNSIGQAEFTFKLQEDLSANSYPKAKNVNVGNNPARSPKSTFVPSVSLDGVNFHYPNASSLAISNISLEVKPGSSLAIVGSTGAGKSTLADLILGIARPSSGKIKLSGMDPYEAIKLWPGKIGYVPQSVGLSEGTIRENIAFCVPAKDVDDERVWAALDKAQMKDFIKNSPEMLETRLGENGVKLSGGQRQRIGLARSIYNSPKFLVLDEATSALDAQTESYIGDFLESLKGATTLIVIAHRLATIRNFQSVIYLENGNLVAQGSFEDIRNQVPNFDHQARLLGL